jgi:antitoxin component HigA of HigAB toxin-antitoxin module
MKKLISAILLCLLFLKIGGYYAILSIQREICREAFFHKHKNLIEHDKLIHFTFSPLEYQQLEWEKADKEFLLKGKLYDIVSIDEQRGKKIVDCLSDEKEDEIKAAILTLTKAQEQENPLKNNFVSCLNILLLKYLNPSEFSYYIFSQKIPKPIKEFYYLLNFYSTTLTSLHHPPE